MSRTVGICLALALTLCDPSEALEPLPAAERAAFDRSVHELVGCTGCHEPGRPDRIPRGQIPRMCGAPCHQSQLEAYQTSVHWGGGKAETVCTDCHGTHGMAPVSRPESRAYRSLVCGTCHPGAQEQFDRGPHREALEKTGDLACASCHSNHAVHPPTIARVEPACAGCHPETSPAFDFGQQVEAQFENAREALSRTAGEIGRAEPISLTRARNTLQNARASFAQARLIWHSLRMDEIQEQTLQAVALAQSAREQAAHKMAVRRLWRIGLGVAWVFILTNIALLHLKKRRLDRER